MGRALPSLVLVMLVVGAGCGSQPEPEPQEKGLGEATADAASDTRVLREAQDAANTVIRAATDCDAVRGELPAALEAIETAKAELRTSTGQTTLDALERQLTRIKDACGIV